MSERVRSSVGGHGGAPQPPADAPLDCWYVAATSDEVTDELTSRRLLGRQVLLYRQRDGRVVALDDRCSHRSLPLSMGRLVDDRVVCRYHGFTFDGTGACVAVPSQEHVPYGADVTGHPVREEGSLVWVWLGDPRRAGAAAPPRVPWLTDEAWSALGGLRTVAAGYLLLHENALDRTHFAYVHPDTSHRGYIEGPPPLEIEVTETSVSYARTFPAAPLTAWQSAATRLPPDTRCVQHESGVFVSPALHVDHMRIEADGAVFRTAFVRAFTPVDAGVTRVHWWSARDWAPGDRGVDEILRRVHERTMEEDEPLLEAIEATIARDGPGRRVNAAADAASVRAEQIVRRLVDEEQPRRLT
jgi:phenylpropionate dioxygenase-like ring-hydroxylating dioxygenase large terminal subunit